MQHIPLDNLTEADLVQLIDDGRREDQRIEYKKEVWRTTRTLTNDPEYQTKQITEFVKDVSAFANATGGQLIVGMRADSGLPVELCGIADDPDQLTNHYRSLLEVHLEPPLTVPMRAVPLANGKHGFVLRVGESIIGPHRVTHNGHGHFYQRVNSDSVPMNTQQIRQAMLARGTVYDRMKQFHTEQIFNDNYCFGSPIGSLTAGTFVLHLLPFESFADRVSIQFQGADLPFTGFQAFRECRGVPATNRLNIDGVVRHTPLDGEYASYIQLFRNGIIEVADRSFVGVMGNGRVGLVSAVFVECFCYNLSKYVGLLKSLGVSPPFWIAISLVSMAGVLLPRAGNANQFFDRNWIRLPEFEITSYEQDLRPTIKEACDLIWQAINAPACDYLDAQGNFRPGR